MYYRKEDIIHLVHFFSIFSPKPGFLFLYNFKNTFSQVCELLLHKEIMVCQLNRIYSHQSDSYCLLLLSKWTGYRREQPPHGLQAALR